MNVAKPPSVGSQISFRTKLFFLLVGALISQLIAHRISDHNDVKREALARDWITKLVAAEKAHQSAAGEYTSELQTAGFVDPKLPDIHFLADTASMPEGLKTRMKPEEMPSFGKDQFRLPVAYTCDGNEFGCLLIVDPTTVTKRIIELK